MTEKTFAITEKEFIEKLTAGGGTNPSPAGCVEDTLLRKEAARIVHNFLRMELQEADAVDGSPAYALQDLFDCRVCAGHIIQVYVKGIMDAVVLPDGRRIFGTDKEVSLCEAEKIVARIFHKEDRISREESGMPDNIAKEPEEISPEQAMQLLKENENTLLADVRTEREYEQGHLENAINVPLLTIIKNPFVFSENRNKLILVYCKEGMQSKAAAGCLLEAGYEKVVFFAWKEKEK